MNWDIRSDPMIYMLLIKSFSQESIGIYLAPFIGAFSASIKKEKYQVRKANKCQDYAKNSQGLAHFSISVAW